MYDQLSLSADRHSSILYWTVVGALVVKGSVNEVQTMIDTAVFDVATTRLLFRAPGVHRESDNSTLVDVSRDLRTLQQQGYLVATDDMILNLNHELEGLNRSRKAGRPKSPGSRAIPAEAAATTCFSSCSQAYLRRAASMPEPQVGGLNADVRRQLTHRHVMAMS